MNNKLAEYEQNQNKVMKDIDHSEDHKQVELYRDAVKEGYMYNNALRLVLDMDTPLVEVEKAKS